MPRSFFLVSAFPAASRPFPRFWGSYASGTGTSNESPSRAPARKVLAGILALFLSSQSTRGPVGEDRAEDQRSRLVERRNAATRRHKAGAPARPCRPPGAGGDAVHSWMVYKPEGATPGAATTWSAGATRAYNGWAPDGRRYGDVPRVLVDVKGASAQR